MTRLLIGMALGALLTVLWAMWDDRKGDILWR